MSNLQHLPIDDLYLFALQFLPESEAKFYREHMDGCSDCRRQLSWVQGDLAGYAMSVEMVAPPAEARETLLRRVAQEHKGVPAAASPLATPVLVHSATPTVEAKVEQEKDVEPSPISVPFASNVYEMKPRRTAAAMAWVGWAVAAGLAVTAGLEFQDRQRLRGAYDDVAAKFADVSSQYAMAQSVLQTLSDRGAKRVALHLPASGSAAPVPPAPEAHASYLKEKGSLVFVANNLEALKPDATYELWLLPAEKGAAPVPAGTFKPDARGNASLMISNLSKGVEAAGFGVTIEPDGGSSTPTMPIVLAGM